MLLTLPLHHVQASDIVTDTLGFDKAMATSPTAVIGSKVSGVRSFSLHGEPGGILRTVVRGGAALRMDGGPLWVVDGIPLGLNLSDTDAMSFLNPYDIESIEVLKDEAATALWGSKGACGVILVSTKRQKGEGLGVEINSNLGLSSPVHMAECLRNAFVQNHSVSVSSVTGQSSLNLSAYYRGNGGVVRGTNSNTGSLKVAYDTKANPVVWFGMISVLSMGGLSSQWVPEQYGSPSLMSVLRCGGSFLGDTVKGWLDDCDNDGREYRAFVSAYLTLNFTKSLSMVTRLGADYRNFTSFRWMGKGTSTGLALNGAAAICSDATLRYNLNSTLSWQRYFGDHHLRLSAGADLGGDWVRSDNMEGNDFFTHTLRAKGLNIQASKTVIDNFSYNYFNAAAFAAASWDFAGYAGAKAVYRADWTPRYCDAQPQSYWSVSGHVDFDDIFPSMKPVLSTLRLSGGYGVSGSEMNTPYQGFGNFLNSGIPVVDKDLAFFYEGLERAVVREWNASVELGALSDRIRLSAKYYRRLSDDMFSAWCFGAPGDSYLWHRAPRSNFIDFSSCLLSSGLELDFSAGILSRENVSWSVRADFTTSETILSKTASEDREGRDIGLGLVPQINVTGYAPMSFYGYDATSDGSLVDHTGDGKVTELDKVILGSALPKYYGGFGTNLKLYGFILDADFDFAADFKTANLEKFLSSGTATDKFSGEYLEKGDWFRFGRLSLAYDFRFRPECAVKGLRLSANAYNLLTVSSYGGGDATVCNTGLDYGSFPSFRTFTLGVKLNF